MFGGFLRLLGKTIYTLRGYRSRDAKDDPQVVSVRNDLQARRFDAVGEALRGVRNSDASEWLLAGLVDWPKRPRFLDAWVEKQPRCGEAFLVRGAHGLLWAWEARTGARAADVKQSAWKTFGERLDLAEKDLRQAATLLPNSAAPYTELIFCSIGKGHAPQVASKYYKAAKAKFPTSWQTHFFTQTYLCQKWMGSHEKMFSFAKKAMLDSPRGSGLATLVAVAHIERYLYALGFEQDLELAERYWHQEAVRADLGAAYRHSLGAPNYRETAITPWLRNQFAFALASAGMNDEARPLFQVMDKTHTEFPWRYFGEPTVEYLDAKLNVLPPSES